MNAKDARANLGTPKEHAKDCMLTWMTNFYKEVEAQRLLKAKNHGNGANQIQPMDDDLPVAYYDAFMTLCAKIGDQQMKYLNDHGFDGGLLPWEKD